MVPEPPVNSVPDKVSAATEAAPAAEFVNCVVVAIVPVPEVVSDAPDPMTIAAAVFVALAMLLKGNPVALVSTPEAGVPNAGVTITQDVTRQKFPLPLMFPAASAGVVTPKDGAPAALPCSTVIVVPNEPSVWLPCPPAPVTN